MATTRGSAREATGAERLGLVTFELADQVFAVPVTRVRRILDPLPVTRAPRGDGGAAGLIDLAGESVPLVDLAAALGLDAAPAARGGTGRIVVVEVGAEGAPVGVAVDRVLDVAEVPPEAIEAPPASMGRSGALVGLVRHGGRLAMTLAVDRVLAGAGVTAGGRP